VKKLKALGFSSDRHNLHEDDVVMEKLVAAGFTNIE
jgi:hypothetical protein